MKNRQFWEKKSLRKFRIIFESKEIVVGADRKNRFRTFRKDTGLIAFSRREVLEMRLNDLTHKTDSEAENAEKTQFTNFSDSAYGFNFG